jgi:hypothetical protein
MATRNTKRHKKGRGRVAADLRKPKELNTKCTKVTKAESRQKPQMDTDFHR